MGGTDDLHVGGLEAVEGDVQVQQLVVLRQHLAPLVRRDSVILSQFLHRVLPLHPIQWILFLERSELTGAKGVEGSIKYPQSLGLLEGFTE